MSQRMIGLKREQMALRDMEAPSYTEEVDTPYQKMVARYVISAQLRKRRCKLILDAGGGVGVLTGRLLAEGYEIVVVDFSSVALRINKERSRRYRSRLDLIRADVCSLPFRDSTFDACLLIGVLQCMEYESEAALSLSETRRILNPKGTVYLSVYNYNLFHRIFRDRQGWHVADYPRLRYTRFTYGVLRRALLREFVIENVRGYENFPFPRKIWDLAIRLLGVFPVMFDAKASLLFPASLLLSENLLATARPRID